MVHCWCSYLVCLLTYAFVISFCVTSGQAVGISERLYCAPFTVNLFPSMDILYRHCTQWPGPKPNVANLIRLMTLPILEAHPEGYLFPWNNSSVSLFPKIKILLSYVPKNCLCSLVPLIFRPLLPCSPEMISLVPLFPKSMWRPHSRPNKRCGSFLLKWWHFAF